MGNPFERLRRLLSGQGVFNAVVLQMLGQERDLVAQWAEIMLKELPLIESILTDIDGTRRRMEGVKATHSPNSEEFLKADVMLTLLENPNALRRRIATVREYAEKLLEEKA